MKSLLLVGAVAIVSISTALAQQPAIQAQPGWRSNYPPNYGVMTAAEKAVAAATIERIERVFWQRPELARPQGYEVLKQTFGGVRPLLDPSTTVEYSFYLWFFAPNKAIAGEGMKCIEVWINRPMGNHPDVRNDVDSLGREIIIEEALGEPIPGATVVHEGLSVAIRSPVFVTFTTGGVFPWKPVTREEYLRAFIYNGEGANGREASNVRKIVEKTTYERWMEEAPLRQKQRDTAFAAIASVSGRAAAEEMRKTLEQTEREMTAQFKAGDDDEKQRNKQILGTPSFGDRLRAELAAMTPAQRASPATTTESGKLIEPYGPFLHRVLTPDANFWRTRTSAAEPHSITVRIGMTLTCRTTVVSRALLQIYKDLDWMALRRIVDRQ